MRTDVLILGAGPAGSALARQLAQAGFAVVLADRAAFPRSKPCGEFLSPQCTPLLTGLGLSSLLVDGGAWPVAGLQLGGFGAEATGHFRALPERGPHTAVGYAIRREVFDHALVQAAIAVGVQFLPRHECVDLVRAADGRVLGAMLLTPDGKQRPQLATWTIGADGVHSRVARALGVQRRIEWLDQFALAAHFEGVPASDTARVQLLEGGFFAATTVDNNLFSVNLVLPRQRLRQRTSPDWDAFVSDALADAPEMRERLRAGHRLRPWRGTGPFGFTTTTCTLPGIALVGDAAGYVDPMTGEGIYFALFGARALGEALTVALRDPAHADAAMAGYRRGLADELDARKFASKLLQRAIRRPWLVRPFVRLLRRWPGAADLLVTLTGDTIHPRELLRPSFWKSWRSSA